MPSDDLTGVAKKAARGGVFLFAGNASSTVILAIGSIIIARLLGPSNYGLFSLTMFVPFLLNDLVDIGISSALVKIPAKLIAEGDSDGARRILKLGVLLKLATGAAGFFVCYVGADLISTFILNRPELSSFLRIASAVIVFQAVFDATASSFLGLDRMQYSASLQVLQSIMKSVLGPGLVLLGFGVSGAVTGTVISVAVAGAVGAAILFSRYARSVSIGTGQCLVREVHLVLEYCAPLYLAGIVGMFSSRYQNIVLAYFATNMEIGNFNAASNLATVISILTYPITMALFPMFSKMDPLNQKRDIMRAFELASKYSSLLVLPATVAVMSLSTDLVYATYGRQYSLAPHYLTLLSSLYILTAVGYLVVANFLQGVGDTSTVFKMSVVYFAIYLPLGPVLASFWSVAGLVVASVLSAAATILYAVRKASFKFDVHVDLKANARILLAALISAIPTILTALLFQIVKLTQIPILNLIVGGLVYLIVYLTLVPVVGAASISDINNLKTMFLRIPIVRTLMKPVFSYETEILAAIGRDS